jgi:hypothetical protein
MPGDPVRVVSGPLCGLGGLYAGMRGAERAEVLLGLLRVNVARSAIERARLASARSCLA